jgi:hypothetical protein
MISTKKRLSVESSTTRILGADLELGLEEEFMEHYVSADNMIKSVRMRVFVHLILIVELGEFGDRLQVEFPRPHVVEKFRSRTRG